MAEKRLKIWFDKEGDYLEVMFEQRPGYFREPAPAMLLREAGDDTGAA